MTLHAIRSGTRTTRDTMKADANNKGTATATLVGIPLRVHRWLALDEADAELRRAVAFRHGCVTADGAYLLGVTGDIDLARCEQTYGAVVGTVAAHSRSPGVRLTKAERAYLTLVAAQFVATDAAIMYGARSQNMANVTTLLMKFGAESRMPADTLRTPVSQREAHAAGRLNATLRQMFDAVPRAPEAETTRAKGSHLRLVR